MKKRVSHRSLMIVLAALAVGLVAAAGFCVFDTDGHDHDAVGVDLCIAMTVVAGAPILFVVLGVIGNVTERRTWAATPVAVAIPDPPPWR